MVHDFVGVSICFKILILSEEKIKVVIIVLAFFLGMYPIIEVSSCQLQHARYRFELGEIKVGTKINRLEIKSNIDNKYRTHSVTNQ